MNYRPVRSPAPPCEKYPLFLPIRKLERAGWYLLFFAVTGAFASLVVDILINLF